MADNIQLSTNVGVGKVLATDDLADVHFQKIINGWNVGETWGQADLGAGNVSTYTQRVTVATDDVNLAAIKTAVELIDNAISGSEMQVDIVDALPAGTNAIGKLAANSGVDIGDVTLNNTLGAGVADASTVRVAIASDDTNLSTIAGDTTSLDGKVTACNTGAVVISSGTITAISNALPAGNNNIGNVDIVTLPAGNLGQQLMAASVSTVPASNITDATYIGDIKFGEALPAGTNAIGKLTANTGVDIGDVTLNNTLGAGNTDASTIRVAIATDDVNLATIAGDTTSIDGKITACNTGAVVISSGTITAVTAISNALPAGDNNIGNVDIVTLPAGNLGQQLAAASLSVAPASNITDATYIGDIKFGESLPAGTNAIGKLAANSGVDIGDVDVTTLPSDVASVDGSAYGKGVLAQGDDGTDRRAVLVDTDGHLQVDVLSGASGGTPYTEDVATANPIVGTATMMERDDALTTLTPIEGDWASLRCSAEGALWVQDFNSDAIAASLGSLDNAVDGNYLNVNMNVAGTDAAAGEGVINAQTQRVTIATDDDGVAHLGTIAGDTTSLDGKVTACNTGAVVISSGTITAVTAISNALPAGDNNIGNVDIASSVALDVSAATVTVDCNSSNVTVDGVPAPLNVVGGGTEAAALRVTIANDSTGVVSIDDNGGALTVDNGGTFAVQVDSALPAGTNTIGGAIAQQSSSIVYDGTTACTVKRFHVVTSTSDTSIITAVVGKKFRVLSMAMLGLSATATNVHLETKTTNTDCFGDSTNPIPIAVDADGDNSAGVVLPWNPGGWFQTADANEDMAIILSAAQPVLVCGNYIEVS